MAKKRSTALVLGPKDKENCEVATANCFSVNKHDTAVWEVTCFCPTAQTVELVFKGPKPLQGNLSSHRPKATATSWPDIVATVVGEPGKYKYDVHVDGKMLLDPDLEIDPV